MQNTTVTTNELALDATESQVVSEANITAIIPVKDFSSLGLTEADLPAVAEMVGKIDAKNPLSVSQFGRDVSEHTSQYTDQLLEQVKNKDLGESGAKLTQIVVAAKGLGRHVLSDRRSQVPVVGPLIDIVAQLPVIGPMVDNLRMTRDKCIAHFQNTREQIDGLLSEVKHTQTGLQERVQSLESMFASVKEEHRLLGVHIAAGKVKLAEMRARVETLRSLEMTPALSQEISDSEMMINNLDKRIGDLQVIQHSALQTLPEIRMIQSDNLKLVEKFHTIKELTVPMWKRQFMLSLSLNEQQNAVELTETIDNATNEFALRQAELLKKNSVATAKANQRLVIDVSTLEKVNKTLISTVEDVVKINQDGQRNRQELETRLIGMRSELENRLVRRNRNQQAA